MVARVFPLARFPLSLAIVALPARIVLRPSLARSAARDLLPVRAGSVLTFKKMHERSIRGDQARRGSVGHGAPQGLDELAGRSHVMETPVTGNVAGVLP